MDSDWKYKFTEIANSDLDEILSYIAEVLANKTAAAHLLAKIEGSIETLRIFPKSGALVKNRYLPECSVRFVVINNYLLYYLPDFDQQTIIILRIVYSRRNADQIIREIGKQIIT